MEAKVFIVRTLDWGKLDIWSFVKELTASDGMFYDKMTQNAHRHTIIENLSIWANFKISYMDYRQKLKDIAAKSLQQANITPQTQTIWGTNWGNDPNYVYLFTDDDDWYSPDILEEILPYFDNPQIDLVTWDCWKYHILWEKEEFSIHPNVGSNGYAQRGGNSELTTTCHIFIDEYIKKYPERCVHIPKPLSVWTRHPGTFSQITLYQLTDSYHWIKKSTRPDCLSWAIGYIDELYEIITTLLIRKE